ncbi:MAG: hypothetical protein ACFFG0_03080 [Candidatus Thorarchaeota archaeon]
MVKFVKGHVPWNKGKSNPKLIGNTNGFNVGNTPWNKGLKKHKYCIDCGNELINHRAERCKKCSNILNGEKKKGIKHSKEHIEKIRKASKRIMSNPIMIKKVLGKRNKSSLEIKFENIIDKLGLPYKFVGNGEVIVARKVPDFVDKNGKKIAIEVYYRRHKEMFRNGLEEWKAERIKIFNENGWKIIFFDETEVTSEKIKNKLMGVN